MSLLNPIWLWALGGLAIPVTIHLLSRKEGKTIRIGSIRFLTETSTSKFSSIRLNEIALLAIRSLLIVLIVLFLANLLIESVSPPAYKWVLVEKGLENDEPIKRLLDSLQKDNYEIRSLSCGFPLPEHDTAKQPPDYYKLVENLSHLNNVRAVVIANNTLSNFNGKRIALPATVTWLTHSISSHKDLPADWHPHPDTVKVTLAYEPTFQFDKKIIVAALQAIQAETTAKILIEETNINDLKTVTTDWLVWLSDRTVAHTGNTVRFKEDAVSDLLVQENRNTWLLTKRLQEENMIAQHLPIQLATLLFNEHIQRTIQAHDNRTEPDELMWSMDAHANVKSSPEVTQSFNRILILVIVALFIAERIFAFYRKQ